MFNKVIKIDFFSNRPIKLGTGMSDTDDLISSSLYAEIDELLEIFPDDEINIVNNARKIKGLIKQAYLKHRLQYESRVQHIEACRERLDQITAEINKLESREYVLPYDDNSISVEKSDFEKSIASTRGMIDFSEKVISIIESYGTNLAHSIRGENIRTEPSDKIFDSIVWGEYRKVEYDKSLFTEEDTYDDIQSFKPILDSMVDDEVLNNFIELYLFALEQANDSDAVVIDLQTMTEDKIKSIISEKLPGIFGEHVIFDDGLVKRLDKLNVEKKYKDFVLKFVAAVDDNVPLLIKRLKFAASLLVVLSSLEREYKGDMKRAAAILKAVRNKRIQGEALKAVQKNTEDDPKKHIDLVKRRLKEVPLTYTVINRYIGHVRDQAYREFNEANDPILSQIKEHVSHVKTVLASAEESLKIVENKDNENREVLRQQQSDENRINYLKKEQESLSVIVDSPVVFKTEDITNELLSIYDADISKLKEKAEKRDAYASLSVSDVDPEEEPYDSLESVEYWNELKAFHTYSVVNDHKVEVKFVLTQEAIDEMPTEYHVKLLRALKNGIVGETGMTGIKKYRFMAEEIYKVKSLGDVVRIEGRVANIDGENIVVFNKPLLKK